MPQGFLHLLKKVSGGELRGQQHRGVPHDASFSLPARVLKQRQRRRMVGEKRRDVSHRFAAEPARRGDAKIFEIAPCQRELATVVVAVRDVVDDAEIDFGIVGSKVGKRCVIIPRRAVDNWQVNEIDGPPRAPLQHLDRLYLDAEVLWLEL